MKNTLIFISLCAVFIGATGQNRLENPSPEALQACIPAHQFAELASSIAGTQTDAYGKTTVALGAYERVSPDGRFILRSFSGSKLGEVDPDEMIRLRVRISRKGEEERSFQIDELLATHWLELPAPAESGE